TGRGRTAKRDPRRKKNQARTEAVVALTWSASQGDLDEVRALLAAGAEPGQPITTAAPRCTWPPPGASPRWSATCWRPAPARARWTGGRHPAVRCRSRRPPRDRRAPTAARRRGSPPVSPLRQTRGSSSMSENHVAGARVVAVLLADGWHRIVPGLFRVGPL